MIEMVIPMGKITTEVEDLIWNAMNRNPNAIPIRNMNDMSNRKMRLHTVAFCYISRHSVVMVTDPSFTAVFQRILQRKRKESIELKLRVINSIPSVSDFPLNLPSVIFCEQKAEIASNQLSLSSSHEEMNNIEDSTEERENISADDHVKASIIDDNESKPLQE
jgi:hypothetical protein